MFKAEYWMISTLFACGVIVGLSYLLISDSKTESRAASSLEAAVKEQAKKPGSDSDSKKGSQDFEVGDPLVKAGELVQEGDHLMVAESFTAATKRYARAQQLTGKIANELTLRMGFCAEFSRQFKSATEHYRRVSENRPTDIHRWVAQSGLARCWLERGNRVEAVSILGDLFLESLSNPKFPSSLAAQVNYQLGKALEDLTFQDYHFDLNRADGVAFHTALPQLEELLSLVDSPQSVDLGKLRKEKIKSLARKLNEIPQVKTDAPEAIEHPQIKVVKRPTKSIDTISIEIKSPLVSVSELMKLLAATCEVELVVSREAESLFSARSSSINGKNVPVALVLDSVLLPLGVIWFQDEHGLKLISQTENKELAGKYFAMAMERFYRRFAVTFPGDYRAASASLATANLKLVQGDLNSAAVYYQELLERFPKEELLANIYFNVGKIEMRLGRNEQALKLFYRTADQTYNRDLQSSAYWLIAQLCLEANNAPESIKMAGRSLALARIDDQRRVAALTLARAYLISNQPLSANQVLFDNRPAFEGSELELSAAVIGSLSRLIGMSDESSLNSEADRLLSAVAMIRDDQFQHFLDIYLVARAWNQLGFRDKAIEKLTLAADSTSISVWRRQFLFELGVHLTLSQQDEKAAAIFEFLVSGEEDQWFDKSLLQMPQSYLNLKRYEDAIVSGEKALSRKIEEDSRQKVLQTMGKAYRELGQHHAAAVCFAGIFREPTAIE